MQKVPAFKYLIFLSLGLLLGIFIKLNITSAIIILLIALGFILFILKYKNLRIYFPFIVILTGILLFQNINIRQFRYPDKIIPDFKAVINAKIVDVLSERNNSMRMIVSGDFDPNIAEKVDDIKLLIKVFGKDLQHLRLREGDYIRANIWVHSPQKAILPGEFDERNYARSSGFQFYGRASASQIGIIERANGLDKIINSVRADLKSRIDILFDNDNAGIIKALLTGDKSNIEHKTKLTFAHTGTAHILAISGLHVGIISSIILLFMSFIPNRLIRFVLFSLLLAFFVVLTGSHPSSIRAAFMAILIYLAWIAQRKINLLNILSLSVIIIILFNPQMIYSVGFQMSVSALLGITILYKPIYKFFDSILKSNNLIILFIKTSLTLTFSVTIVVSPLVAYYFGYYSYVSPLANLFAVPLITLVVIYAILTLAFSYIYIPFAFLFSADTDFLLDLIKSINEFFNRAGVLSQDNITLAIMAIALSLAMFYIFKSKTKKQILFRTLYSGVVVFLFFTLINLSDKTGVDIFPRKNFVVVEMKEPSKILFLILDRKKKSYIETDFSLIEHIMSFNKATTLFYTGHAGEKIAKKILKIKHINTSSVDLLEAETLLKQLGLTNAIYQKINI